MAAERQRGQRISRADPVLEPPGRRPTHGPLSGFGRHDLGRREFGHQDDHPNTQRLIGHAVGAQQGNLGGRVTLGQVGPGNIALFNHIGLPVGRGCAHRFRCGRGRFLRGWSWDWGRRFYRRGRRSRRGCGHRRLGNGNLGDLGRRNHGCRFGRLVKRQQRLFLQAHSHSRQHAEQHHQNSPGPAQQGTNPSQKVIPICSQGS